MSTGGHNFKVRKRSKGRFIQGLEMVTGQFYFQELAKRKNEKKRERLTWVLKITFNTYTILCLSTSIRFCMKEGFKTCPSSSSTTTIYCT